LGDDCHSRVAPAALSPLCVLKHYDLIESIYITGNQM